MTTVSALERDTLPKILRTGHKSVQEVSTGLYFDLMKQCLRNTLYMDQWGPRGSGEPHAERASPDPNPFEVLRKPRHTMIGPKAIDNVQFCVEDVLTRGVPGDLIETGVWRGGTTIFMRAILAAYEVTDRTVWVADSFEGLPPPDVARYPADEGYNLNLITELAVSLDEVKANFARYGLLDDRVGFLKGWFKDTLPNAPIEALAVLRLDGDLYESTMDALTSLYPKLSPGGWIIVDDYWAAPPCRKAVDDYRATHGISEPMRPVDFTVVYWRRS